MSTPRAVAEVTAFVVKAAVRDPRARTFVLREQKTMYGGKHVAAGAAIFVFASENAGGTGLVARGVVTSAAACPRRRGVARQTPRVSIRVRRTACARRPLGRRELRALGASGGTGPAAELHFKFYRQATDKLGGISAAAAAFLDGFFR